MKKLGEKSSPAAESSIKPLVFHNIRVVIITSHFHLVWLVWWNYYSWGFICGDTYLCTTPSVCSKLVLSGGIIHKGLIRRIWKFFWKKSSKRMSMAKSNFRKLSTLQRWRYIIILSALFVSHEILLVALVSWKLLNF